MPLRPVSWSLLIARAIRGSSDASVYTTRIPMTAVFHPACNETITKTE